ncbi:MAG TPA: GAF domain-containing protein, partial [Fimbriimonadaceae bacterium]|nr:GAF domain-containing protein [Fimbriimonadaceae bacterium]
MRSKLHLVVSQEDAVRIVRELTESPHGGRELRQQAMQLLSELPGYNWSGVYRLEGADLLLDEYVGAATDHNRIPIGTGVCGTAVAENRNVVVEDVRTLDNYLACSLETRSEIVVLIRSEDHQVLGQIDIDGHEVGAFGESDEAL